MKHSIKVFLVLLATVLMSSSTIAAIDFSDDFESYPLFEGGDATDLGGGWLYFVNVFTGFPTCDPYLYGYGPGPTPNGSNISNIVEGSTGKALNAFSNYGDGQHGNGNCLETNVFQERIVTSSDTGLYTFRFETQVPVELGEGVSTYGFIKLLDPNNGYATEVFETVSTTSAGEKFLTVKLTASAEGKILQWGFANVASNYLATGRFYDNVTFAIRGSGAYEGDAIGVPVPFWAYIVIIGSLMFIGVAALRSRKKTG